MRTKENWTYLCIKERWQGRRTYGPTCPSPDRSRGEKQQHISLPVPVHTTRPEQPYRNINIWWIVWHYQLCSYMAQEHLLNKQRVLLLWHIELMHRQNISKLDNWDDLLNEILWRYLHHITSVPLQFHHITSEGAGRGWNWTYMKNTKHSKILDPASRNQHRCFLPWPSSLLWSMAETQMRSSLHTSYCVNAYSNIRYSHIKNAPWKYKECFLAHQVSNRKQTCTPVSWWP